MYPDVLHYSSTSCTHISTRDMVRYVDTTAHGMEDQLSASAVIYYRTIGFQLTLSHVVSATSLRKILHRYDLPYQLYMNAANSRP